MEVGKPTELDAATGEILVKKSTGAKRVRRGQTTEEYQEQLRQFRKEEHGPTCLHPGWMQNLGTLDDFLDARRLTKEDLKVKHIRHEAVGLAHRLHYRRRRSEALKICEQLAEFGETTDRDYLRSRIDGETENNINDNVVQA